MLTTTEYLARLDAVDVPGAEGILEAMLGPDDANVLGTLGVCQPRELLRRAGGKHANVGELAVAFAKEVEKGELGWKIHPVLGNASWWLARGAGRNTPC